MSLALARAKDLVLPRMKLKPPGGTKASCHEEHQDTLQTGKPSYFMIFLFEVTSQSHTYQGYAKSGQRHSQNRPWNGVVAVRACASQSASCNVAMADQCKKNGEKNTRWRPVGRTQQINSVITWDYPLVGATFNLKLWRFAKQSQNRVPKQPIAIQSQQSRGRRTATRW